MGEGREGDWDCGSCANRNYAFRSLCNRCKQPRLLVDAKTPADSKWLPRIGDWICTGCSNNNYASREKCKKCGQPKEAAAMPALVAITAPAYFVLPNGWRTGDWICICGFHNYSSRAECKKCNVSLPPAPGTTSSMLNTAHGTKRLASEECFGEWDNKRLNVGDITNQFLTNQLSSYQGYEHIGCPSNDKASVLYPYSSGTSASSLNSQVHIQLPQPAPLPILLGKGAKQWRDGDWLCTNCNNHNYASRSQCNRCKTEKVAVNQPVTVA